MTLRDAAAALQMAYPNMKITAQPTKMPTIDKPSLRLDYRRKQFQRRHCQCGVALPPNQQIVWEVDRTTGYAPGSSHKPWHVADRVTPEICKESYSSTSREGAASEATRYTDIYWMFDEKGSRLPLPNSTFGQPGYPGCEAALHSKCAERTRPGGSNASAYSIEYWVPGALPSMSACTYSST